MIDACFENLSFHLIIFSEVQVHNSQDAKVQNRLSVIDFHQIITNDLGLVLSVKKGQRELMMLDNHLLELMMLLLQAEPGRGRLPRPGQEEQENLLQL